MSSIKLIDKIRLLNLGLFCILFFSVVSGEDVNLHKCVGASDLADKVTIPNHLVSGGGKNDIVFRINSKPLKCLTNWTSKSVSKTGSTNIDSNIRFTPTGVLFLHSEYFDRTEYCISRNGNTSLEIAFCEVKCGITHICLNKCCGLNKVYNIGDPQGCVPSGELQWAPTVYSKDNYKGCGQKVEHLKEHVHYTPNQCSEEQILDHYPYKSIPNIGLEGIRFRLLEDGRVVFNIDQGEWKAQTNFCIDGLVNNYNGTTNKYTGDLKDQVILACSSTEEEEQEHVNESSGYTRTVVYTVFIFVGIIFLVLTAIVYLLLWDKHNIHGWTVFSFVISMLLFFSVLAASHIMAQVLDSRDYGSIRCIFIGIIVHFFFLCTMCWMSVINVDLWLTFRSLAPSNGRTKMIKRYCIYSSFAVGVPFVIVIFGIILDNINGNLQMEDLECGLSVVSPRYGQEACRVHPSSQGLYLYLPMGILLGSNMLMFSSTVFTLWRYQKNTQNAANASSSGNQNQSLVLFCKLFIVMGITWVTEIISWSLSNKDNTSDWYIWILFDVINLLQAVAVFFIFAAKRENLYAIYRKYPRWKKFIEPIMRWGPCRMGIMEVEQTDMTSADKNRIDRNTKVNFNNSRMSSVSQDDF